MSGWLCLRVTGGLSVAGGLCTAPYHRYSEAQTQVLGSFRTPPVTSRRETNWLLHWLWAHSGKALEAPRCLGVRRRLGGSCSPVGTKPRKATERCGRARAAPHTREGGKTGA